MHLYDMSCFFMARGAARQNPSQKINKFFLQIFAVGACKKTKVWYYKHR